MRLRRPGPTRHFMKGTKPFKNRAWRCRASATRRENAGDILMATCKRVVPRRPALAILRLSLLRARKQQPHELQLAVIRRRVQRQIAFRVADVRVCATRQKHAHDRDIAFERSPEERRSPALFDTRGSAPAP